MNRRMNLHDFLVTTRYVFTLPYQRTHELNGNSCSFRLFPKAHVDVELYRSRGFAVGEYFVI